jgi:hypothetical protein
VREPSVSWALAGLVFTIGGVALLFASIVLLGFSAPNALEGADAATAQAVGYVAGGLFLAAIGSFFGLVPLLFGAAVVTGDEYPGWLGWLAGVGGAVGVVTASLIFFDGYSGLTDMVLFPIASLLFTVWIGIMGFQLWQKASVPEQVTTSG